MIQFALLLAAAASPTAVPAAAIPPGAIPPGARIVSVTRLGSPVRVIEPAAPAPPDSREPRERLPLPSIFSADDAPLGKPANGIVGFTLTIDALGRVSACEITRSSGSPALDQATCAILRRRERFVPATEASGHPVAATVKRVIEWKMPQPRL
jgi:protein TonB